MLKELSFISILITHKKCDMRFFFFLESTQETKWWLQNYPVISAHSLSTYVSISLFIYFLSTNIPSLSLFTSYLPSLSPFIYPSLLSFFHLLDLQQFLRFDIPSMRMFVPRSFTHDKYPEWITVRGISFRSLACSVRSVDRQTMWCDYCRERNRAWLPFETAGASLKAFVLVWLEQRRAMLLFCFLAVVVVRMSCEFFFLFLFVFALFLCATRLCIT